MSAWTHTTRTRLPHAIPAYVPILGWLPKYDRANLRSDAIAGLTVWGVGVPSALAYAQLAGLPPEAGLYAMMIAMLIYAVFGTSRQMKVTTSSTMAVMSAAVVAPLAGGDMARYWLLTSALAFVVGLLLLIAGIIKLGFIANFLSKPVVTGFVFGLAITIAIGQLPKIFGVPAGSGNVLQQLAALVQRIPDTNPLTFATGGLAFIGIVGLKRRAPQIPASLVALALGILVSAALNLSALGVSVVGDLPRGLPGLVVPLVGLNDAAFLIAGAAGIVFLAAGESLGTARAFAIRHRYDINPDQELVAMGLSNVATGLTQGLTVDASLSATATADAAGAKSQVTGLVSAALTALTLLLLASLFAPLPNAVLAAVVINSVLSLMDVRELKRYWQWHRVDFALGLIALFGVLLSDVLTGLTVAVLLSLMLVLYRASRPYVAVLGKVPGQRAAYGDIKRHPGYEQIPGVVVCRLDAPLFFANASVAHKEIRAVAASKALDFRTPDAALNAALAAEGQAAVGSTTPLRAVIVDLGASADLDVASLDMLRELVIGLREAGIELLLVQVRGGTRDRMRKTGLMDEIGPSRIFFSVEAAVANVMERAKATPEPDPSPTEAREEVSSS